MHYIPKATSMLNFFCVVFSQDTTGICLAFLGTRSLDQTTPASILSRSTMSASATTPSSSARWGPDSTTDPSGPVPGLTSCVSVFLHTFWYHVVCLCNSFGHVAVPPSKIEIAGIHPGSRMTIRENEMVELRCVVHNAKPKATIVWFRKNTEYLTGRTFMNNTAEGCISPSVFYSF